MAPTAQVDTQLCGHHHRHGSKSDTASLLEESQVALKDVRDSSLVAQRKKICFNNFHEHYSKPVFFGRIGWLFEELPAEVIEEK